MYPIMNKPSVKLSLTIVLVFQFALGTNAFAQAKLPAPKKYAILIGVTKYDHAGMNGSDPLQFPEADANAIGELLTQHGYQVEYLLGSEATREAIQTKLQGLINMGNAEGVAFVGFFGHGVQMEFRDTQGNKSIEGCFCPFDTNIRYAIDADGKKLFDKEKQLTEPDPKSLVKMSEVVEALSHAKADTRFMIADCCREAPNRARGRNLGLGANFNTDKLPTQTVMLFGCKPGELSLERNDWGHGAFTLALLEELSAMAEIGPVMTGTLADRVKLKVQRLTSKKQNPIPISLDTIDLMLDVAKKQKTDQVDISGSKAGQVRPANSDDIAMAWIPAGSFKMGSLKTEKGNNPNESQVSVALTKGFWLAQTEVTQGQWKSVMGTEPWKMQDFVKEGSQYAATYISWDEANAFLSKLNEREHRDGTLPRNWSYKLPTEAQWEYACRHGTSTRFSFGESDEQMNQYAWFARNSGSNNEEYAHEVGKKKANTFGLHDMHGNVWEWCRDTYLDSLAGGSNPEANTKGPHRVFRGGGWNDPPVDCRSAFRNWGLLGNRFNDLGFRVSLQSE